MYKHTTIHWNEIISKYLKTSHLRRFDAGVMDKRERWEDDSLAALVIGSTWECCRRRLQDTDTSRENFKTMKNCYP